MSFKVVVADSTFGSIENELSVLGPLGAEVNFADADTDEKRIASCWDADAVLLERGPFNRNVIEKLDKCKILVRYGVGYDEIDVGAATDNGIAVSNVPDYCVEEVADHALLLLLALERRLITVHNTSVSGLKEWNFRPFRKFERLRGKVAGVVGLGRIGSAFAKKVDALGLEVLACDPFIENKSDFKGQVELVRLEELLERSDFVSMHTPLNDSTYHLIGKMEMKKMKTTAFLINCARGPVVDQLALTEALEGGQIAGAALDVQEVEPPTIETRERLFLLPNVIITPHIGWYSEQSMVERQIKGAQTVAKAIQGVQPSTVVNPEVYKLRSGGE